MGQLFIFASVLLATSVGAASSLPVCSSDQVEMSVETIDGSFCTNATHVCSGDVYDGSCPPAQAGLPSGSYCGIVASGVYGCKPNNSSTTAATIKPVTQSSVSPATPAPTPSTTPVPAWKLLTGSQCAATDRKWLVVASEDIFCLSVSGRACSGTYVSGMVCPGPQQRLPYGSSCRFIGESDYVGCYTNSATGPTGGYAPLELPAECMSGMRVSGQGGHYCVKDGTRCQTANGVCPHPQQGLPNGSYCQKVDWGYYECVPNSTPPPSTSTPARTVTSAPTVTPTASTPPGSLPDCATGSSPMSVEGIVTIYCAKEPACVADRSTGNCPGPQQGLPLRSSCGLIQMTGVYGCKPNSQ